MSVGDGAVRKRAQGLIAETWQSQANLSLFLGLEILIAFILPSLGFGREDTQLYSDIGFSVLAFRCCYRLGAALAIRAHQPGCR